MGRKAVGPVCCANACKITQCTYQKEKGFAPVFLAELAAYCATAPCKPLHGAKVWVLCLKLRPIVVIPGALYPLWQKARYKYGYY